ncbi:MAG: class I SAM-dependent methyltransferase, partial [Bdellovibrionales bacterium]|nr:class I SAM-dependent methyltransferase [Oligoflexia bacterium]
MAKFEADLYRQFRISYPLSLFESLKPYCQVLKGEKLQVLDLGAGTGLATRSFLQFYPDADVTLVEPDANMLDEALRSLQAERPIRSLLASAESFHLPKIFDLALIASAWHWMSPQPTLANLTRALKPGGAVWLAEYQFPKAMGSVGTRLNEWVRREFNLRWKPQSQVPRGSLDDLIAPFRRTAEWSQVKSLNIEEMHSLSLDHFLGVIF